MERAKKELESRIGIDPITKCVHVSASMDGAYRSSSCFSSAVSTTTGKVLAYKVATNSCCSCTRYRNKEFAGTLSEQDQHNWDTHKPVCQADYSDYATVQPESAIVPEFLKQAYERGIVFHTLVCDGDNDTVGSLNDSLVYGKLNNDQKIREIECLSHVMRNIMNNLVNDQVEAGKSTLSLRKHQSSLSLRKSNT